MYIHHFEDARSCGFRMLGFSISTMNQLVSWTARAVLQKLSFVFARLHQTDSSRMLVRGSAKTVNGLHSQSCCDVRAFSRDGKVFCHLE